MINDLAADDIAQQLCLFNFSLFKKINPIEFLNQIWIDKKDKEDSITPALDCFISRFDKESYWVATEICGIKDFKKRINVLKIFINAAKKSQEYCNFFTMFSILAGLSLTPVQRLKKTWDVCLFNQRDNRTRLKKFMKNCKS